MNRIFELAAVTFILTFLLPGPGSAQISAPLASGSDKTNYTAHPGTDSIYIFCAATEGETIASLRAQTDWEGSKTFLWEKYNDGAFELYFSESTEEQVSQISNLADGCYRLTITQAANSIQSRAWVFNNWFTSTAAIGESNCEWFTMNGEFETPELVYYDLTTNAPIQVFKDVKVQWKQGENNVAAVLNPQIYNPPAKNTEYLFRAYDKFGCESTSPVTYESIVPEALFTADPVSGEAPLTVNFTNTSLNADPGLYEWFFFYDLDEIKRKSEGSTTEADSIEVVAYDQSPIYIFEKSGQYMVKLVAKKTSEQHTCVDTVYLPDYITVDTSFIAAPNVFSPNGDGVNDEFIVKFWSMQSIEISIFNRWGKRIHYWESGDVRGFEGSMSESVWDGRLMGNRYASPGVYYYDVTGRGRDGEKRRAHGFVHLFRGKD